MAELRWMRYTTRDVTGLIPINAGKVPPERLSLSDLEVLGISSQYTTTKDATERYELTKKTNEAISEEAEQRGATIVVVGTQRGGRARFREGIVYFLKEKSK